MRLFQLSRLLRIGLLAILLGAMLPSTILAQETSTETSHTFDGFDVTVTWEENWKVRDVTEDAITRIALDYQSSLFVSVIVFDVSLFPPEEAIDLVAFQEGTIVEDNRNDDVPSFKQTLPDLGTIQYWESYVLDDGSTTALVGLEYIPLLEEESLASAMDGCTINGNPPFRGAILAENGVTDLSGDATPQTDVKATPEGDVATPEASTPDATEQSSRTSRTSRGGSDGTETPEATAESTEEPGVISRTPRGGSDGTETPEATAEATEEPGVITRTPRGGSDASETPEATEEPGDTTLSQGMDTYTSDLYGFTISFDPNVWRQGDTLETSTIEGVQMDGNRSTVFFIGTDEYGADPVGCLVGEDEYYSTNSDSITNWEVATGSNGDPLWYESDELAWGVFRYTFTSTDGDEVEFVDYISCETIPGEDAVLLVQLTSTPEDYNDNLDAVLDVLDTIEFGQ